MDLTKVDLNLLLALDVLVELRSVTRAAERLGVKQPAMSATLAKLRALFEDDLLVRSGSELQVTPRAAEIASAVAPALGSLRLSLGASLPFTPGSSQRSFTIASSDYTSMILVPPLVASLARSAPLVDLRIIGYEKGEVDELLEGNRIDAAIGVFPAVRSKTAIRTALFDERFIGVARAEHPILSLSGARLSKAFVSTPHALCSVRRDARGAIDDALAKRGLSRRIAMTIPHMLALPMILGATDWLAAIPLRVGHRFVAEGLRTFELPLHLPAWSVDALYPVRSKRDASAAWLRRELRAAADIVKRDDRHRGNRWEKMAPRS